MKGSSLVAYRPPPEGTRLGGSLLEKRQRCYSRLLTQWATLCRPLCGLGALPKSTTKGTHNRVPFVVPSRAGRYRRLSQRLMPASGSFVTWRRVLKSITCPRQRFSSCGEYPPEVVPVLR